MKLILRADATPQMGTGHVMRNLSLAQAAQDLGHEVIMCSRVHVDWARERIKSERVSFLELSDPVKEVESPEDLLNQLAQSSFNPAETWVVLDGYHFTTVSQDAVLSAGYRLVVIDDYAHLPQYSCDILLNQNPDSIEYIYEGRIGKKLLGPMYSLLRREFRFSMVSNTTRYISSPPKKILITLGGGNFSKYLPAIAKIINTVPLENCSLRIIRGAMDTNEIENAFASSKLPIEILDRVDNMPSLLLDVDLCITAGGSSCWELCCMGTPFMTLEVAENQHGICEWLDKNDIAPILSQSWFKKLTHSDNTNRRNGMRMLVDGKGAEKVICEIQNYTQ